jgi:hypothetical protein
VPDAASRASLQQSTELRKIEVWQESPATISGGRASPGVLRIKLRVRVVDELAGLLHRRGGFGQDRLQLLQWQRVAVGVRGYLQSEWKRHELGLREQAIGVVVGGYGFGIAHGDRRRVTLVRGDGEGDGVISFLGRRMIAGQALVVLGSSVTTDVGAKPNSERKSSRDATPVLARFRLPWNLEAWKLWLAWHVVAATAVIATALANLAAVGMHSPTTTSLAPTPYILTPAHEYQGNLARHGIIILPCGAISCPSPTPETTTRRSRVDKAAEWVAVEPTSSVAGHHVAIA